MTSFRIEAQWEEADEVKAPELAATWARLSIFVGDECLTLVRDSRASGYRDSLDISVYPLAEWIAFNWWFLTTPNAGRNHSRFDVRRHTLSAAGDGFPLPSLMLLPERDTVLARQEVRSQPASRVQFVRSGFYLLDLAETTYALERFVDDVVRRLDDHKIDGTRLQEEWRSVQSTTSEERDFCVAAATLGLDPYSTHDADAERILRAAEEIGDLTLLADLATGISPEELDAGVAWLTRSLDVMHQTMPPTQTDLAALSRQVGEVEGSRSVNARAPWRTGYARARTVRDHLGLAPTDPFDPTDYVADTTIAQQPPGLLLQGVCHVDQAPVLVSSARRPGARHFLAARVLARALFDGQQGTQVITHGSSLRDKAERATAAELLAPAEGIAALIDGAYSEDERSRLAQHFGVDELLIDHQIENQLHEDF